MKRLVALFMSMVLFGSVLIMPIAAQSTQPQWWQETVWYLLFVRSFYDSDGDGVGDIQGIIEKLDYLNDGDPNTTDDLGITGIWLLPTTEAESYHGYDTVDYYTIEQDYGTNEDFQQLIAEAEARGIRIIVDLVINHTGDQHPWFLASAAGDEEFTDWYLWEEEEPDVTGVIEANAWHYNNTREAYYYGAFWSGMPDLNHRNPAVTEEMNNIARFWLEDMGAHGFRLDAVKYLIEDEVNGITILEDAPVSREYLGEFTETIHSIDPDAISIAEIFDPTNVVQRYMDDDVADVAFEFSTASAMITAATAGNKREIERQLINQLFSYDDDEVAIFLSNHDQNRVMSLFNGDETLAKVAANLLLTMPGTPFIYYGEEIGMEGVKPDELIRRPMQWDTTAETGGFTTGTPWQPLDENFAARTVAEQSDNPDSLLNHYRSLIQLRNSQPALQYGETLRLESTYRAAWGYIRYTEDDTLLVLFNLDDRESRDYTISLDESPFSEFTSAELIYSNIEDVGEIPLPELNEEGGFANYIPVPAPMPPTAIYVWRLQ